MPHFSRLSNMLSSLQRFERFMIGNLPQRLQFLLRTAPSPPSPGFNNCISHIEYLLLTQDETSDSVTSALKELRSLYPLPPIQIIPKEVWPNVSEWRNEPACPNEPDCYVSVQTHMKSTFVDAVHLLKRTGRDLSETDEKYLRLLLTHGCGWSATYPDHMDDSWVKFFHIRYPQLDGLMPILDSMTYPEELIDFPDDHDFREPRFFLFATSDRYFIWDESGQDLLYFAGDTLEDVYNMLKDWRWYELSNVVEVKGEYLDPYDYLVTYERKGNGNFGIHGSTEEYPGKKQKGLWRVFLETLNID